MLVEKEKLWNCIEKFVEGGILRNLTKPWSKLVGQMILARERYVSDFQKLIEEKKEQREIPKYQKYSGCPSLIERFERKTEKGKKKK